MEDQIAKLDLAIQILWCVVTLIWIIIGQLTFFLHKELGLKSTIKTPIPFIIGGIVTLLVLAIFYFIEDWKAAKPVLTEDEETIERLRKMTNDMKPHSSVGRVGKTTYPNLKDIKDGS